MQNEAMPHDVAALMPGDMMRAAVLTDFGEPDALRVQPFPTPTPANSELLVRVLAAGVNPIDAKTRSGSGFSAAIRSLPWVLGGEFAGVVVKAPYELAPFQPGDEVFGMVQTPAYTGAHAEVVATPMLTVAHKPESLTMQEAGAVPLAALTAWAAVIEAARVRHGMRMLIHGGSGGVGHFAVQLASVYGAEVTATASKRNQEFLRELGATHTIDYSSTRFEDAIDGPVDVVIDLIGNVHDETGSRSLKVLADGGTYICVPTGAFPDMHDEINAEDRGLIGSGLKCSPDGRALRTIAQLIDQGDLRVTIDEVFPLERIADAHERIADGHTRGKIVLDLSATN